MKTLIRNCRLGEGCHQEWDSLQKTANPNMRFCLACRTEVHSTKDTQELWVLLEQGYCVALLSEDLQGLWLGGPHQAYDPGPKLEWD